MIKSLKNIFVHEEASEDSLLREFKQNYFETNEFVRASIYWMVRSEVVDDIVQETFLKAWKNYKKFKRESSFKTWIYRIAMNCTYDYLKKNPIYVEFDDNEDSYSNDEVEFEDMISTALKSLTDKHREVFILYYKFEYTVKEIASTLNEKEGTIKSRLYYAKESFEKIIGKIGGYDE